MTSACVLTTSRSGNRPLSSHARGDATSYSRTSCVSPIALLATASCLPSRENARAVMRGCSPSSLPCKSPRRRIEQIHDAATAGREHRAVRMIRQRGDRRRDRRFRPDVGDGDADGAVLLRPGIDPGAQQRDFFRTRLFRLFRRHERFVFMLDEPDDAAGVRLARRENRAVIAAFAQRFVRFQVEAALGFLAVVAFQTIASEKRFNLFGVTGRLRPEGVRRECRDRRRRREENESRS